MKTTRKALLLVAPLLLLASCGSKSSADASIQSIDPSVYSGSEATGTFSITSSDGTYTSTDSQVTITSGGTFTLSGSYSGIIVIEAGESDTVELDLNGVSLSSSSNSPIFASSADKVKIKAIKDTYNTITDSRSAKTTDSTSQGEGAIYAKCDLSLVGKGTLIIVGNYNDGIHCTKDLTIKNQNLKVTAYADAIQGNNSLTIEENPTLLAIGGADGLKTSESSITSSGKQKGTISIVGGTVEVQAYEDAIDAAYNVVIAQGSYTDDDNVTQTTIPSITLLTNKYATALSSYSVETPTLTPLKFGGPNGGGQPSGGEQGNTNTAESTAKGIKAANKITISNGAVSMKVYDDGIHADYGGTLENGSTGVGDIEISGGNISIYATDDAIHADRYLTISGGTINVSYSYEALEGTVITISGGSTTVYGEDDGVNASKKINTITPALNVTGGTLDVTIGSGDTDGIDSNGNITISGGTVVTRGAPGGSSMATGIDCDGTAKVTGGLLVCFGSPETKPTAGTGVSTQTISGTYSAGTYTIKNSSISVTTTNTTGSYSGIYIWSSYGTGFTATKA